MKFQYDIFIRIIRFKLAKNYTPKGEFPALCSRRREMGVGQLGSAHCIQNQLGRQGKIRLINLFIPIKLILSASLEGIEVTETGGVVG